MNKVFVGENAADLDIGEKSTRITRVTILVDNDHQYTAGDDTGRTLEKTVPWGTQAMANAILAAVRNYDYQPFTGTDTLLDPAAEIGDGITIGGVYSVLAQKDIAHGALTTTTTAAPSTDEIEDEYPYLSKAARQQQRNFAQTQSMIKKSSEEIIERVEAVDGRVTNVVTDLSGVHTSISDLDGRTTRIDETVNGITVKGDGGTTYIKPGAIQAKSITGSMIAADTITADNIKAGSIGTEELRSDYLNIGDGKFVVRDGNITIQNCNITLKDYSITGMKLKDDAVDTRTIANDAVKSDQIYNGAVTAKKINARGLKIGPSDNDIEFEVTQDGHVIIGGDVTMKSGVIKWADIDGSTTVESDIKDAKKAGTDASKEAGDAAAAAKGASDDVLALAKGEYTKAGKTFISKDNIYSPNITGGTISGAMYYDENRQGYMDISNTRPGWFEFGNGGEARSGGRFLLNIGDNYITMMNGSTEGTSMLLRMYDGGLSTARTLMYGAWDFTRATVTGLTAKFG